MKRSCRFHTLFFFPFYDLSFKGAVEEPTPYPAFHKGEKTNGDIKKQREGAVDRAGKPSKENTASVQKKHRKLCLRILFLTAARRSRFSFGILIFMKFSKCVCY